MPVKWEEAEKRVDPWRYWSYSITKVDLSSCQKIGFCLFFFIRQCFGQQIGLMRLVYPETFLSLCVYRVDHNSAKKQQRLFISNR